MKTTVIYHSADYDGIFCREIARKFVQNAEFIGWDYGDPKIPFPKDGTVYVLDLSPDCLEPQAPDFPNSDCMSRMVWIDHHKSSLEKWNKEIPGYRIDGVAACRLAWQWFANNPMLDDEPHGYNLPEKDDYSGRKVTEPLAVTLAGEYDIWDHQPSNGADIAFQFGLDSQESLDWKTLLMINKLSNYETSRIVGDGKVAMRCYAKRDADIVRARSFIQEFSGLKFLALNTARCSSNTFAALDVPETGHDALMGFYWNGKRWTISLYHARHRTDLDLSEIAIKCGGGGHRGACGFTCGILPF